ncbi:MAG TPA: hypothetical protein VGH99_13395 [Pseudonocardia sp.]
MGWAIEHLWFLLREPLDWLAGDPEAIKAHAATWRNIAAALSEVADRREAGLAGLTSWRGEAGATYRARGGEQVGGARRAAGAAGELSGRVLAAGAAIGTTRSVLRDIIAQFVADAAEYLILSAALAVGTAGGSLAAGIVEVVVQATALARRLVRSVSELLAVLAESGQAVGALSGEMAGLAETLGASATRLATRNPGEFWRDAMDRATDAGDLLEGAGVEAVKQSTAAASDEWVPLRAGG